MKTTLTMPVTIEIEFKYDEATNSVRVEWLKMFDNLTSSSRLTISQSLDFEKQILAEIQAKKTAEAVADSVG